MTSERRSHQSTEIAPAASHHGTLAAAAWLPVALPPTILGCALVSLALAGVPLRQVVIGGATPFGPALLTAWHIIPAALVALLIGGTALGILRGLPRWTYTWFYAVMVMVGFVLVVLAEDRPSLISPAADLVVALSLLAALVAVAAIAASRGSLDALLAGTGFFSAFVLVSFSAVTAAPFRRVDLALLAVPAGLAFSALIVALIGGRTVRWLCTPLVVSLGAGLMWLYTSALTGFWASAGSQFASRVVVFGLVGLVGPTLLTWLLGSTGALKRKAC